MKRGGPLPRRTPLARVRMTQHRRLSEQEAAARFAIRAEVFARDHFLCRLTGAPGVIHRLPLDFHHRRKASQGGAYSVANGAVLCRACNEGVESDADLAAYARSVGLVVRRGDPEWESLGG